MEKRICKDCEIKGIKCNKCYKKEWYEKNKVRLSEQNKLKYEANKEEVKERVTQYRNNNKEKIKIRDNKYYEANKEKIIKQNMDYVAKNKEKTKTYKKQWAKDNEERLKLKRKGYYQKNKDRIKQLHKDRMKSDPIYAITCNLRKNILKAFRERAYEKNGKTVQILGCSFEEFKNHLESQFEPWMTWENRGLYNKTSEYGWDIDHIIPLAVSSTIEEVIELNHYTNLQPLCSYINRNIKRAKLN